MMYVMQVHVQKTGYIMEFLKTWLLKEDEMVYAPTYERIVTFHGERKSVTKRFFPGYLFIQSDAVIDFYTRLREVKTAGFLATMTRILGRDEGFLPLSDREEKAILSLIGRDHHAGMSYGRIRDGKLTITRGPLTGREGDIIRIDRHKKTAVLSMPFLGRDVQVRLGLEITEKS